MDIVRTTEFKQQIKRESGFERITTIHETLLADFRAKPLKVTIEEILDD